jgi:hypothetical protein
MPATYVAPAHGHAHARNFHRNSLSPSLILALSASLNIELFQAAAVFDAFAALGMERYEI